MNARRMPGWKIVWSLLVSFHLLAGAARAQEIWVGAGKKAHAEGCPRLASMLEDPQVKETLRKISPKEWKSQGIELCSKCPGIVKKPSALDPGTKVYVDAMWFRVHAEDCPELLLKERKQTMTLEEADKAGARIGESGQSGRTQCCLHDYARKYPEKKITDDTLLAGNDNPRNVKHLPGCHRYWPDNSHRRRPMKDWIADGFAVCPHCIERGPSLATITEEEWANLPAPIEFVPPAGWEPKAFSMTHAPSREEVDMLVRETLAKSNGIQELPFVDPVATAENFMTMRFFFPVSQWLDFYKAYRATGDKRILDKLLESARHYNTFASEYPSVAQAKAGDPEGLAFMYSMAAWSRFTLQLARKQPDAVGREAVAEAEAFLKTMVSILKPICEADDSPDPDMGIPRKLADDFRSRAFNRAMNGIGTLSMITAALEDLQALKGTTAYQPTIARYRKIIREYVKHWQQIGHFCDKIPGETHFVYPYVPETNPRLVEGCKIFKRTEDEGHYGHTLQGLMCIHESTPDLGVDEAFMTAVANAVHFSRSNKIKRGGKEEYSGHIQCPTALRVSPQGGESVKGHAFERGPGSPRYYMLEAFREGLIDALGVSVGKEQVAEAKRGYGQRLAILHARYLQALRQDRSLVHLGQKP